MVTKSVRGPQLELGVEHAVPVKCIQLRMPAELYAKLLRARAEETKQAPPYTPTPTVTDVLIGLIAEYAEFWTTVAETETGKVLVRGLKRKGARRG